MRLSRTLTLTGVLFCVASITYAQQAATPTPSSTPPASSTPAPTWTPPTPSQSAAKNEAATLAQKAKDAGMKQETHGGTTYYCWKEAVPNSRLPEKRCVNEEQLAAELDRRQARREQFQQSAAPGVAGK